MISFKKRMLVLVKSFTFREKKLDRFHLKLLKTSSSKISFQSSVSNWVFSLILKTLLRRSIQHKASLNVIFTLTKETQN